MFRVPSLIYPLIVYNLLGLFFPDSLAQVVFSSTLISDSEFSFSVEHVLLVSGLLFLAIEVIKSTRTSLESVLDHSFSVLVFVLYLLEFILVRYAGNATFLLLTLMALIDVITGFTVTISTARRDVTVDGGRI